MPETFIPILIGWCGIWASLAGIGFLYGLRCTDGESARRWWTAFWCMHLFWIAIDLGIVVWALLDPIADADAFRRILMINGFLDLLYLATGVILITRKDMIAKGFGAAILIQSAFLFLLDWAWWLALGTPGA